jgi:hypothetical protein
MDDRAKTMATMAICGDQEKLDVIARERVLVGND